MAFSHCMHPIIGFKSLYSKFKEVCKLFRRLQHSKIYEKTERVRERERKKFAEKQKWENSKAETNSTDNTFPKVISLDVVRLSSNSYTGSSFVYSSEYLIHS